MKILFYHYESKLFHHILYDDTAVFIKSTSLYLKTYIEIKKPDIANRLEWCIPQQIKLTDDELVDLLEKEKPDLFCTTHYIWNYVNLLDQLKRIKHRVDPNMLFLAGGPSVDVNVNPEYFRKNDFIDYAFYGPGEKAFAEFIDCLINKKPFIKSEHTNMAWPDEDRSPVVADYEYVPQLKTSPYLHNVKMLKGIVADMHDQGCNPIISYELTRGCPYSCTFCDWNSGFGNKTTRRKDSYKEEIDLFQSLGATGLFLSDANLGQYQEDVDMIEYFAEKNLKENAGFRLDYTVSKLKKDNNLKIFHTMGKANLCTNFVISVQDSNERVLENIDRPDVGWDVHSKHIKELHSHYPQVPAIIQLIQGLPGQTVESWKQTLSEISKEDNSMPIMYVNEVLSASPAARSQEYKDKWNFEYSYSMRWDGSSDLFFRSPFAKSCVSFTPEDFVEMTMASLIYSAICKYKLNPHFDYVRFDYDGVAETFFNSDPYKILKDNLLRNWLLHDNFYFTVEFDGTPSVKPITACSMPLCNMIPHIVNNPLFLKWTAQYLTVPTKKAEYAKHIVALREFG